MRIQIFIVMTTDVKGLKKMKIRDLCEPDSFSIKNGKEQVDRNSIIYEKIS